MNFPEFSYTRQMEGILTIIAIGSTAMFFYLILMILLKIYDEKINSKRKALFVVTACLFYTVTIYGTYAVYGFHSIPNDILSIIVIPNPVFAAFCYYFGIKMLNLSSFKSISVVRQSFFYMLITVSMNTFIRRILLTNTIPYNYLLDALTLLLCDALYILLYLLITSYINKHGALIHISDSFKIKNWKLELICSFFIMILAYLVIIYIIISDKFYGYQIIITIMGLTFCLYTDLNIGYSRVFKNQLLIKDSYISSLSNSIDSFNELKKEFNNTLNSYDTYLEHGNLESLKLYHESLIGKTILTNEKIELSKKMFQNPVLISILIKKLEYANSYGVLFVIPTLCSLENMYIDDLDLSRVLGNLLDNAIESAAISPQKRVSFSVKEKEKDCKIIIISNSTKDDVNIDKIIVQGTTTKEGHKGLGIIQVRNSMRKYANCSLHFAYYKNEFSVYIEVWS